MKKILLITIKIILGLAMLGYAIFEIASRSLLAIFFTLQLSPIALFFGGLLLIIDGSFNVSKDWVPAFLYRNIALCLLFVLVNSVYTANSYFGEHHSELDEIIVYGTTRFFIIGRIILPALFLLYYLLGCKEKKINIDTYVAGFPLFVAIMVLQLTISWLVGNFYFYDYLIAKPLETAGFGEMKTETIIGLIALSVLVSNLLLIFLNRLKYKIIRRPVESVPNNREVKRKAAN